MGRYVFKLPDVGEGTAEAEIVAWHVAVGDHVHEDQTLVDVMTDKATVEMTSPVSGVVVSLNGNPGDMAAVGAPLVELDVEGAGNVKANGHETAAKPAAKPAPAKPSAPAPKPVAKAEEPKASAALRSETPAVVARVPGTKPLASPSVRARADELGIKLQFVPGTGPAGRIGHADLDAYVTSGGAPMMARGSGYTVREGVDEIKVIGLRRKIAEKMQESKRRIPHFAYVEEIDMTELEALRQHLNATKQASQPKLTLLPFLMRGLVKLLPSYPQINARFDDEAGVVHRHAAVHIGIATQTANGLIVPVVRHAEARDVWDSAAEVARVATVINHPEVAIIGPNAIVERPVVRDGQIVVRKMMNLSSSFDHRVVDGYDAAEFIQKLKGLLEHPATLFME